MNKEKGKKLITIKNKVAKTSTKAKKKALEKPKKKKKRGKILNFILISIMLLRFFFVLCNHMMNGAKIRRKNYNAK